MASWMLVKEVLIYRPQASIIDRDAPDAWRRRANDVHFG